MRTLVIIFVHLTYRIYAKENDSSCITPNNEHALCVPIHSCKVIKQAITYLEPAAVEFAKKSQCGYDDGPLVCCGSTGRPTTPKPVVTSNVEISSSTRPPPPNAIIAEPINDLRLPDHTLCGIQSEKGIKEKIIGGESTGIREFPWMVALKYVDASDPDGDASFRCSGTLINHRYVLTAAQCLNISGYKLIEARLGEWRLSSDEDCSEDEDERDCADPIVDVKIIQTIRHPYYSKRDGNNDIALLLLENKVNFTDFVRPICLPPFSLPIPQPKTEMLISGWGVTETGAQSDVKLKVKLLMKANEDCVLALPDSVHINSNQACAGGEAGRDACSGDSGGPLMGKFYKPDDLDEEQFYQEGIIYKGLGCGQEGIPGLYTRISRYTSWILNNLKYP